MPDPTYWNDPAAREALLTAGREALARARATLDAHDGVVAIEPQSGTSFVGKTLGKVNRLAYDVFPDQWLYFCRLDDPAAEILLPTW
jgi:hypothetical protein